MYSKINFSIYILIYFILQFGREEGYLLSSNNLRLSLSFLKLKELLAGGVASPYYFAVFAHCRNGYSSALPVLPAFVQ